MQNLIIQFFFIFWPFFVLPESYQNDPKKSFQYRFALRHSKISKNGENTTQFWSRTQFWSGVEAFIATAIFTNFIGHLVWLFGPQSACLHGQSRVGALTEVGRFFCSGPCRCSVVGCAVAKL